MIPPITNLKSVEPQLSQEKIIPLDFLVQFLQRRARTKKYCAKCLGSRWQNSEDVHFVGLFAVSIFN